MRFNKLLLGAALIVPMMMTSCDPDAQDAIEISYLGQTEITESVPNKSATFTLPFKLSRTLKNGEYMDDVRISDLPESHNASLSNSTYKLNGTSLDLVTTVTITGDTNKSCWIKPSFSINVLKSSGAILKQYYPNTIKLSVNYKTQVSVDSSSLPTTGQYTASTTVTQVDDENRTIPIQVTANTITSEKRLKVTAQVDAKDRGLIPLATGSATFETTGSSQQIDLELDDEAWGLLFNDDTLVVTTTSEEI